MTNRLCIFAHYDRYNEIDPYVVYYLKSLLGVCSKIVFVSTSELATQQTEKLSGIVHKTLLKANQGHDFGSWRQALLEEELSKFDEVLICNDSCYGPVAGFEALFKSMEKRSVDFWGLTKSNEIADHLQTYFVCFRKPAFSSSVFREFWRKPIFADSKKELVRKYEVGLTRQLAAGGFRYGSFFSWKPNNAHKFLIPYLRRLALFPLKIGAVSVLPNAKVSRELKARGFGAGSFKAMHKVNLTHYNWRDLLNARVPLIKIDLLRDNPNKLNLEDSDQVIRDLNPELADLIKAHLKRMKKSST